MLKEFFLLAVTVLSLAAGCAAAPQGGASPYRLVTRAEFAQPPGGWRPYGQLVSWKQEGSEVLLTLADGRVAVLDFLSPSIFHLELPATAAKASKGESSDSGQLHPRAVAPVNLSVSDQGSTLLLDSSTLEVSLSKSDLAWKVLRGDTAVLEAGPPESAGSWTRQKFLWGAGCQLSGLGPTGEGWDKT
ncbi:MAG: hypothetical protein HKM06_00300, partial [Spirochaetales bacterium]|nr:hypothetical protein [Spirochaetales bacterium]